MTGTVAMARVLRRLTSKGTSTIIGTNVVSRKGVKVRRSYYHELSFALSGEPAHVLEYHQYHDNRDGHDNNNDDDIIVANRPSPQHVGVDMLYAPLNPADLNTIQGTYPAPKDTETRQSLYSYPASATRIVAGSEGIGRVRHAGGSFVAGDIVTVALPGIGTMRSHLWAPSTSLIAISRGHDLQNQNDDTIAAISTLPQLGGTAMRMLNDFVTEGPVIQNAGNSGVGFMVSQLATLMNRQSISVVRRGSRTNEEWERMKEYLVKEGKSSVVVAEEDLTTKEEIQSFFKSISIPPPSLALNAVGGASASLLTKLLRPGGTMVTYGGMSKQPVTVGTPHFIFKDLQYHGYWHSRWMTKRSCQEKQEMIDSLVNHVMTGTLACPHIQEFNLSDFQEALKFDSNQSGIRRKIVFRCQED